MKGKNEDPYQVVTFSAPVSFLLLEDYEFAFVACEDMPNCSCGYLHLMPPVEGLICSEFLEESEAKEIAKKAKKLRKRGASEELTKLAVEVHETLDDRAAFDAAEWRARFGIRFDDDPPPELFAKPPEETDVAPS